MSRSQSLKAGVLALAAVLSLIVAGVASGRPHTQKLTTVKVAALPINFAAAVYVGVKQGYFAKEGLDVQPQIVPSTPAAVAAVTSGSVDFGLAGPAGLFVAMGQGIDIKIVWNGARAKTVRPPEAGIVVRKDSTIRTAKDLEGKTVAVSALRAGQELSARIWMIKKGADPNKTNWIALPVPSQQAALESGQVDAMDIANPYLKQALDAGHRFLVNDQAEAFGASSTVAVFFTSGSTLSGNPDLVRKFTRAIEKANKYSDTHPTAPRSFLPTISGVTEEVAKTTRLARFAGGLHWPTLVKTAQYENQFGWIPKAIDLNTAVWSGALKAKR